MLKSRDGGAQAFGAVDLLSALLLFVAARAARDDIALLEQAQSQARAIGWHPIWDVLLVALAREIAAARIRRGATGSLSSTSTGRKHLAILIARPNAEAPAALQMPLMKLKRRMNGDRISAMQAQAATRAESA